MLPSSSEQLILQYHKAKDEAVKSLSSLHARIFNDMAPHIDRVSAMLVSEIKPLLDDFKKAFPTHRFFILPITQTFGGDIAPGYQTHLDTRWCAFCLDENHQAYGLFTMAISEENNYPELYEKLNDLENSFLRHGIAFETLIPPDKNHLEVMLSHKRFN